MEANKKYFDALIDVIKTQSALFLPDDRAKIWDLVGSLSNDCQQMSDEIIAWCEDRPKIEEAFLKALPKSDRIQGDKIPEPPQNYIVLLENAIRENLPPLPDSGKGDSLRDSSASRPQQPSTPQ